MKLSLLVLIHALLLLPVPELFAQSNADLLFQAGKWVEAEKAYENVVKQKTATGQDWLRLAISRHELGKYNEALAAYAEAAKSSGVILQLKVAQARTYSRLGDRDSALKSLEDAARAGFVNVKMLQTHKDFETLRDDARFTRVETAVQKNLTPCRFSKEFRDFDFWIGEWNVDAAGQRAGVSSIQLILDECVVFENWTGLNGYAGKSFNIYNPTIKKWQQLWVDNSGGVLQLTGEYKSGQLQYQGQTPQSDGSVLLEKLTFYRLPDNKVRQVWEQSSDGKQWRTVFDGLYTRK